MVLGLWDGPRLGAGGGLKPTDLNFIKNAKLTKFELYNLRTDLAQQSDLAAQEPDRLRELSALLVKKYREVQREGPTW